MSRSSIHAAHRAVAAIDEAIRLLVEQAPSPDTERAVERARAATGGLLGWASAEALTRLIVELVRCTRQAPAASAELDEARKMLAEALMYDGLFLTTPRRSHQRATDDPDIVTLPFE